jgi:hypothetical protein
MYQAAPVPTQSNTTTPGKIHPPSPLYYDYTEDFGDEYSSPEIAEPPPPFQIEKTIPEDRPMSSHWQSRDTIQPFEPRKTYVTGPRSSSLPPPMCNRGITSLTCDGLVKTTSELDSVQQLGKSVSSIFNERPAGNFNDIQIDKKTIRLSGLGVGAQQLNIHVQEAFGLPSSPSFELAIRDEPENIASEQTNIKTQLYGSNVELVDGTDSQSIRNSTYSLNTHLQKFPPPPEANSPAGTSLDMITNDIKYRKISGERDRKPNRLIKRPSSPPRIIRIIGHDGVTEQELHNTSSLGRGNSKKRSSMTAEMDPPDIPELTSTFEESNRHRKTPATLSQISDGNTSYSTPSKIHIPLSFSSMRQGGDTNVLGPLLEHPTKLFHRPSKKRRVEAATVPIYWEKDVPNFSHQLPRRFMSRSESPMLAPKPISPARQLKLKNSVPQLMKALPPVPPDKGVQGESFTSEMVTDEPQLPYQFLPLTEKVESTTMPVIFTEQETTPLCQSDVAKVAVELNPVELDSSTIKTVPATSDEDIVSTLQPPKLKLKIKHSSIPLSYPLTSHPWNLDESYPWSSKLSVELPSVLSKRESEANSEALKQPKFKLKIIRASNSTLGTVRVHRDSGDSRSGLNFRNPKDLFSPSETDKVMQKIGKHLHLRKTSGSSHIMGTKRSQHLSSHAEQGSGSQQIVMESVVVESSHQTADSRTPASPTEVRSFFSENSSHVHDRGSFRNRLSRFKARITLPYKVRTRAQSHDDITWRSRTDAPIPKAARSHPDLHTNAMKVSIDTHSPLPKHVHRITEKLKNNHIRAKMSEWFKEARSALRAYVKPRNVEL